jgi:Actin
MSRGRPLIRVCASALCAAASPSAQFTSVPGVPYRLPDGTEVMVGLERFKVPELLFNTGEGPFLGLIIHVHRLPRFASMARPWMHMCSWIIDSKVFGAGR